MVNRTTRAACAIAVLTLFSTTSTALARQVLTTVGGDDKFLASVDPETGRTTNIGFVGKVQGMVWDGHDIYATQRIEFSQHALVRIDPKTAAVSTVSILNIDFGFTGMTYDSSRDVLWGIANNVLYTVDREEGSVSSFATIDPLFGSSSLAYDPVNDYLLMTPGGGDLYSYEFATRGITKVGSLGMTTYGLAIDERRDEIIAVGSSGGNDVIGVFDRATLNPLMPTAELDGPFPSSVIVIPAPASAALLFVIGPIAMKRRRWRE